FKSALNNASDKAATRLRTAYDSAVQKGTDRYIELLFALANGPHLAKQFKQICTDYEEIMKERPERPRYNTIKNNGQDIRNALESLSKRRFLR
ncbi:hypothetical protein, partial [Vibrio marinisediminis]